MVALGFSIPISTALDNVLVAALLVCWLLGGRYSEKWAALRVQPFVLLPCGYFALHVVGAGYSAGSGDEVLRAIDKASVVLLIPILISLQIPPMHRERAVRAFMAVMFVTLVLSVLLWVGMLPSGGVVKGASHDPAVFKLRITHGALMAFAAFAFAVMARETTHRGMRLAWALLAGLASVNVLFMVLGRTGQLILLVLLLYLFLSWMRWRGLVLGGFLCAAIATVAYLTPSSALHQRVKTTFAEVQDWRAGKRATPVNMRLEAWSNSVAIAREHPFLGVGTGGFPTAYSRQVEGTSMLPVGQPENQYLLTAVQLGALGLATLLAMFAYQWHLGARLPRSADRQLMRAMLLTIAVGSLFNSFLLDHTEALFYAWLSGLLLTEARPS